MSLYVDIEKDLGSFKLKVKFEQENGILGLLGKSGFTIPAIHFKVILFPQPD